MQQMIVAVCNPARKDVNEPFYCAVCTLRL